MRENEAQREEQERRGRSSYQGIEREASQATELENIYLEVANASAQNEMEQNRQVQEESK